MLLGQRIDRGTPDACIAEAHGLVGAGERSQRFEADRFALIELDLASGKVRSRFTLFSRGEWPNPVETNLQTVSTLNGQALKSVISAVQKATATDDSRPTLNAVDLRILPDGRWRTAAADGFRMHVKTGPPAEEGAAFKQLLPVASARLLVQLLSDYSGPVAIGVSAGSSILAKRT